MSEARLKILEAIARRKIITVIYNGAAMRLAPHMMFERHEDFFVIALNLNKDWREGEEKRLGQFKVAGLGDISLTDATFQPLGNFDGVPPRADDLLILATQ